MCEGACQLYDLLRQVLFAIRVGKAWTKCVSLSSESVVDFRVRDLSWKMPNPRINRVKMPPVQSSA